MASSSAGLPFAVKQDSKSTISWYHKEDENGNPICGSNNHALAQIIQDLIQKKKFDEAIAQIEKCIKARQKEINKRDYPDPAHDKQIVILENFIKKIRELEGKNTSASYSSSLLSFNTSQLVVSYNEPTKTFIVRMNGQILGGRKKNRVKKYTQKTYKKSKKNKNKNKKTKKY
jgi:hypothetical protein